MMTVPGGVTFPVGVNDDAAPATVSGATKCWFDPDTRQYAINGIDSTAPVKSKRPSAQVTAPCVNFGFYSIMV